VENFAAKMMSAIRIMIAPVPPTIPVNSGARRDARSGAGATLLSPGWTVASASGMLAARTVS